MTVEEDPDKCYNRVIRNRKKIADDNADDDNDDGEEDCCKDINLECANHIRPVVNCHQNGKINKENYEINDSSIKFEPQIRWLDFIAILYVHLGCLYGIYLLILSRSLKNYIWCKY